MIYTITGKNDFLRTQKLHAYVTTYKSEYGTHELEYIMAAEADLSVIVQKLQSLPFLSPKKCIVVHDLSSHHSQLDAIQSAFEQIPESTDLFLYEPHLDKRTRYASFIKKQTTYHELQELDEPALIRWLVDTASHQGGSLSSGDAKALFSRVGPNQYQLYNELQKLLTYSTSITKDSIEALVDVTPQSTSFALLDAAFDGHTSRALHILDEQRTQKIEPQMILGLIIGHVSTLALLHEAPKSARPETIATDAGLHPYVVRKSIHPARRLSRQQIQSMLDTLRFIDKSYKHSSIDIYQALQFFIVSIGVS